VSTPEPVLNHGAEDDKTTPSVSNHGARDEKTTPSVSNHGARDDKTTQPPISEKPKTKMAAWKRIGIMLIVFLGSYVGYQAIRNRMANGELNTRLVSLKERGLPFTLAQLYADKLPDEDNAQTWINRSLAESKHLGELLNQYYQSKEFNILQPTEEQAGLLIHTAEEHGNVLANYIRASRCVGHQSSWRIGDHPSESLEKHLEGTSESRAAVRYMYAHASLLMVQGKYDEALDLGLQMLALSRLLEHEPMVVGYMVGVACRMMSLKVIVAVMERRIMDDGQRDRIDAELARCESVASLEAALKAERIYALAMFRTQIIGRGWRALVTWKFKYDACDYLDLMDEVTELIKLPRHAITPQLKDLGNREVGYLTASIIRAFMSTRISYDRALSRVRCVRLLNNLQRQYPDGFPPKVDVSKLPGTEESRQDPFTGKPLVVRVTEKALAIYSVGVNEIDDRGNFEQQEDEGYIIEIRD
jgi:hypothetical protein